MSLSRAKAALKQYFGYDTFRPLQADIIRTVYEGRDALVLMPTGGGKSLCYQVPAITLDGTAVVLSPLIALMKDQVEGLSANGVPAAFLNSTLNAEQVRNVEDALLAGYIKLLYVSPEKLVSQSFQPLLKRLKISLFAIDEAHCISAWGHDFRPEYTQLRFLKEQFPQVPILALTATADKLTRKDIVAQLNLPDPQIFISSFDRPNISLQVRPGQRRYEQIVDFLKQHQRQSGIIYCLSRRSCEELSAKLNAKGFKTAFYHADLPARQRNQVQEDFINDKIPVICATIAFGMGIDKSNVRFVIHYNLPRNLESYYQEIGRAGRDGLPSSALLFFSYSDVQTYRQMFEEGDGADEQKQLKIAKLERMFQFAEAPVCRRQTVLQYFGESHDGKCGHCDVCENPPRRFDGTTAAQKALSALLRTGEKVGMQLLVDILRGSRRQEVLEPGFDKIKTYGAGKEYSYDVWMFLLSQMLHQGLLEIAYDDFSHLRVTETGKKVLFENKQVVLAMPPEKAAARPQAQPVEKSKAQLFRDELFDALVMLRRSIAQKQGIPPYLVFSDATLSEMAEKRPLADADMMRISGVGERKLHLYGDAFMEVVRKFVVDKSGEGAALGGSSYLQTWEMFKQGNSVEAIAEKRRMSPLTITGHLAIMYEKGELVDIRSWVRSEQMDLIQGALPLFGEPYELKEIYDHFEHKFSYTQIQFSIADFRKQCKK